VIVVDIRADDSNLSEGYALRQSMGFQNDNQIIAHREGSLQISYSYLKNVL